jgi:hypothetical protein
LVSRHQLSPRVNRLLVTKPQKHVR